MQAVVFGSINSMTALAIPGVIAVFGAIVMMFASFRAHHSILRVGLDLLLVIAVIGTSILAISQFIGQSTSLASLVTN